MAIQDVIKKVAEAPANAAHKIVSHATEHPTAKGVSAASVTPEEKSVRETVAAEHPPAPHRNTAYRILRGIGRFELAAHNPSYAQARMARKEALQEATKAQQKTLETPTPLNPEMKTPLEPKAPTEPAKPQGNPPGELRGREPGPAKTETFPGGSYIS
jgi:hypothetical protein